MKVFWQAFTQLNTLTLMIVERLFEAFMDYWHESVNPFGDTGVKLAKRLGRRLRLRTYLWLARKMFPGGLMLDVTVAGSGITAKSDQSLVVSGNTFRSADIAVHVQTY